MTNINSTTNNNYITDCTENYLDFNTAEEYSEYGLIPAGTLARVKLHIRAGNHNDESKGWKGNYATRNEETGAIYLNCEFTIIGGRYARHKIWQLIGLYSNKNNNRWGAMGRSFIRIILNSAKGFNDKDMSEAAVAARKISSLNELEGLEFAAGIEVEKDLSGNERNVIKRVLTPQHKDYAEIMGRYGNGSVQMPFDKPTWA